MIAECGDCHIEACVVTMLAAAFVPDNGVCGVSVQSEDGSLFTISIQDRVELASNSKHLHSALHFLPRDEENAAAEVQTPKSALTIKPDNVLPRVPARD